MESKRFSLGLNDKNGKELFSGDQVQITNGARSGSVVHDIKAAPKAFTISGVIRSKDGQVEIVQVAAKKVMKLNSNGF